MADYLGEFEHLMLLAIARLGEDAHGVTVREMLWTRAKRRVSYGAIYSAVRRLEDKGLLKSALGDPSPVRGGRARKLLTLTPRGKAAVKDATAAIGRMAEGVETL